MCEAQGKAWKAFQGKWCVNLELEDKEALACRDWAHRTCLEMKGGEDRGSVAE